jgi:pSer/pThr/pTyr-binding forkhead associated (FHA) protein/uncharacterized protein YraI
MSYSRPSGFGPGSSQEPEPRLQIVVHAGPLAGKGFPITGNAVTFGRDPDNDISWDDSQVSRKHARLTRRDNQLILEDLGSTNGTLVNGKPIAGEHVLQPADIITIGSSIFGVKGFAAPSTVGVTQVSRDRLILPPALAKSVAPPSLPKPATPAPPQLRPVPPPQSEGSRLSLLVISLVVVLIAVVLIVAAVTAYIVFQNRGAPVAQIPTVVITAPVAGSELSLNQPVTIQATASDPTGVVRMELWVSGVKTAEAVSPVEQGQPTLTASLQWVPVTVGSQTLEIRAYNQQGEVNEPTVVVVTVVEGSLDIGTPTPTVISGTPTATTPTKPSLTTRTDLNVRAGPDTVYDLIGLLPSGTTTEIIGRDESRQWWQIRFDPSPNGIGWVSADPEFSTTYNVENLPISQPPPTPTGTPTSTPTETPTPTSSPVPPTVAPTATPVPPTDTPTPTLTPTPPGPTIDFTVSSTSIQGGQCVTVRWNVTGVREVYYQGEGVAGTGDRLECPADTTTYRLRIVRQDGSEHVEDRTVQVINPVTSAGKVTLDHNDTIDLDDGDIPGDDFKWDVGDGNRRFEAREDEVKLAIIGTIGSLEELSEDRCEDVDDDDFDNYRFIDASDVISDPANALKAGLAICYKTDDGRLGKLRFPEYSTGGLKIEWVTWR